MDNNHFAVLFRTAKLACGKERSASHISTVMLHCEQYLSHDKSVIMIHRMQLVSEVVEPAAQNRAF